MPEYIDSRGRSWRGSVSPADIEAHGDREDLVMLGREIAARMGDAHGAASALARAVAISRAHVCDIVHGRRAPSGPTLDCIAAALRVDDAATDRWHALAGHVAPDLKALLLAHPDRWAAVRALLEDGRDG